MGEVLVHSFGLRSLSLLCALSALLPSVFAAPEYINGQMFTDGLAIIDAPAPNNPGHAGANIPIAIDVSGDGQLPLAASVPGSGRSTSFQSLEIYLVSSQTNLNLTVSTGPGLLTGEPQSTVKHLDWPIPTCVPSGNYNLTFYETSQVNGQLVFTITPIPVPISNSNPSGSCSNGTNPLQPQPQASNPLGSSPFAPGVITLTLTISDGVLNLPTQFVTVTAKPTPTTVVLVSVATVTETEGGTVTTITSTATMTTQIMLPPTSNDNTSGFLPVNAASRVAVSIPLSLLLGWAMSCLLLYQRML